MHKKLQTSFIGLTMNARTKADKWLKSLIIIHEIFFFGYFIMPMTGGLSSMSNGTPSVGGVIVLEFWCVYFLSIGVLAYRHFRKDNKLD